MVLDSLRYWVDEMRRRLSLRFASILTRSVRRTLLTPVLWDIESDPHWPAPAVPKRGTQPAFTKGQFIGDSWKEWNGRFRDDVRSFFRGEDGAAGRLADRIGQPPKFSVTNNEAEQTSFRDLPRRLHPERSVSYNQKHNEEMAKTTAMAITITS